MPYDGALGTWRAQLPRGNAGTARTSGFIHTRFTLFTAMARAAMVTKCKD